MKLNSFLISFSFLFFTISCLPADDEDIFYDDESITDEFYNSTTDEEVISDTDPHDQDIIKDNDIISNDLETDNISSDTDSNDTNDFQETDEDHVMITDTETEDIENSDNDFNMSDLDHENTDNDNTSVSDDEEIKQQYPLVINEIDYENYGSSPEKKQFIEIYNKGTKTVSLDKIKLYYSTWDTVTDSLVFQKVDLNTGSTVSTTDVMSETLEAGKYILIHKGWDTAQINKFSCNNRKIFNDILKDQDHGAGAIALAYVENNKAVILDAVSYGACLNGVKLPSGSFVNPEYLDGTYTLCENAEAITDLDQNYLSISRLTDGFDTENGAVDFKLSKPPSPCTQNTVLSEEPETILNGDFQDVSMEGHYDVVRPGYHFRGWITSSYVDASNGGSYPYDVTSNLSVIYSGSQTRWILKNYFRCSESLPYEMTFKIKGYGTVLFELAGKNGRRFYVLDSSSSTFNYDSAADSSKDNSYTAFNKTIFTTYRVSFGNLDNFCTENDVLTFSIWSLQDDSLNASFDDFSVR